MINSIVRSPSSFFDTNPSGILINKLSNDLGTIDNNLFYSLTEAIEGPISAFIAIINISFINLKFLAPSLVIMGVAFWFFNYSRPAYIKCKQLFLQSKNIMIHFFNETINGLAQIRIYKQNINKMQEFSDIYN